MDTLEQKNLNYLAWIKSRQDGDGFIESDECDSIGFSSLLGCVPGVTVNIDSAFDKNTGQWHRRPCTKPCFPEHSKSTISRDMILMLLWYAYHNKRLDISEQIIKHALNNYGIMGKAIDLKTTFGRCLISPGLLSTAAWVSYRLGGPSRPWLRWVSANSSKQVVDYQAHLSVLHALLRDKLTGKNNYKDLYKYHYKRQPNNPLFAIAAGLKIEAEAILNDSSLWPEGRLPTNLERKEPWLQQREMGDSWLPDLKSPVKTHSGGDYLFLYWLLTTY